MKCWYLQIFIVLLLSMLAACHPKRRPVVHPSQSTPVGETAAGGRSSVTISAEQSDANPSQESNTATNDESDDDGSQSDDATLVADADIFEGGSHTGGGVVSICQRDGREAVELVDFSSVHRGDVDPLPDTSPTPADDADNEVVAAIENIARTGSNDQSIFLQQAATLAGIILRRSTDLDPSCVPSVNTEQTDKTSTKDWDWKASDQGLNNEQCTTRNVVVFSGQHAFVGRSLYRRMSIQHRAALWLHEAFYLLLRQQRNFAVNSYTGVYRMVVLAAAGRFVESELTDVAFWLPNLSSSLTLRLEVQLPNCHTSPTPPTTLNGVGRAKDRSTADAPIAWQLLANESTAERWIYRTNLSTEQLTNFSVIIGNFSPLQNLCRPPGSDLPSISVQIRQNVLVDTRLLSADQKNNDSALWTIHWRNFHPLQNAIDQDLSSTERPCP